MQGQFSDFGEVKSDFLALGRLSGHDAAVGEYKPPLPSALSSVGYASALGPGGVVAAMDVLELLNCIVLLPGPFSLFHSTRAHRARLVLKTYIHGPPEDGSKKRRHI